MTLTGKTAKHLAARHAFHIYLQALNWALFCTLFFWSASLTIHQVNKLYFLSFSFYGNTKRSLLWKKAQQKSGASWSGRRYRTDAEGWGRTSGHESPENCISHMLKRLSKSSLFRNISNLPYESTPSLWNNLRNCCSAFSSKRNIPQSQQCVMTGWRRQMALSDYRKVNADNDIFIDSVREKICPQII